MYIQYTMRGRYHQAEGKDAGFPNHFSHFAASIWGLEYFESRQPAARHWATWGRGRTEARRSARQGSRASAVTDFEFPI